MATLADIRAARTRLDMSILELWFAYFAVGGNHDAADISAYLNGGGVIGAIDHDHIIDALNDTLTARGHHDSFLTYGLD